MSSTRGAGQRVVAGREDSLCIHDCACRTHASSALSRARDPADTDFERRSRHDAPCGRRPGCHAELPPERPEVGTRVYACANATLHIINPTLGMMPRPHRVGVLLRKWFDARSRWQLCEQCVTASVGAGVVSKGVYFCARLVPSSRDRATQPPLQVWVVCIRL